jgi:hypothetical protein
MLSSVGAAWNKSRLFMPLLTDLGGLGDRFRYTHVAPSGAPAPAFQQCHSTLKFLFPKTLHEREDLLADLE